MKKATEIISYFNESNDVKKVLKKFLNELEDLQEYRANLELELDNSGLLNSNSGKIFYKADGLLDKAIETYKKIL